ncbi:hypothetical protein MMC25_007716 [Agyrium rufum]|nr:hypothetical protein [Agyrium rufum]
MATDKSPNPLRVLWQHPNPKDTQIFRFKQFLERERRLHLPDFRALHAYSVQNHTDFWLSAFSYFPIIYYGTPKISVDPSIPISALPEWFPGITINFAENILYTGTSGSGGTRSTRYKEDSKIAVVEIREAGSSRREITWGQLRARTLSFAAAMKVQGVRKGDRIALVAGNGLDTLCVFLGATSLGALFSSSSCDMGSRGILERLVQIKPKWVFVDDVAIYNGKTFEIREKMEDIVKGMKDVAEFQGVVSVPRFPETPRDVSGSEGVLGLEEFLNFGKGEESNTEFERIGFQDGFLIVYSSGTTGAPKCIVHGAGGIILGGWKEAHLHREIHDKSTMLQFTTTGWIMYLGSIMSLLFGAKVIMYDGSPFLPRVDTFLQLIEQEKVTHFGSSPRYLQTLQTNKVVPKKAADLSSLKLVTSTGMVLPPAMFTYFYSDDGFPSHVHLANISGGTDIAGAFGDANALEPVYESGGCQGPSLGMDVQAFDPLISEGKPGRSLLLGEEGELVCVRSFPNTPIKFWGDEGNKNYHSAYYSRFKNVWTHGDLISIHPHTKAIILHGRADGVLNPSGVRFGSAEIYSVIDAHFEKDIEDSVCVGQRRPQDKDERVLLFVKMRSGKKFTPQLSQKIKTQVATSLSRRHVPAHIFETPEIPTTINSKKVETPLKAILCGRTIIPSGTLANPGSLDFYKQFVDIEAMVEKLEKAPPSKL